MPNRNPDTNIAYGTIYVNNLDQDFIWDAIGDLPSPELDEAYAEYMRDRATELIDKNEITYEDLDYCEEGEEAYALAELTDQEVIDMVDAIDPYAGPGFFDGIDESEFRKEGEIDGVKVSVSSLGGAALLWVTESPFTGYRRRCSPCVPGAGSIEEPAEEGEYGAVLCYLTPPEWLRKD